ncbi:MAG: thiamine diphosphokinase [Candidatus Cloacimonadaceae bacterium]|jgi:thiamine pyrophosphokinase|nr:thiamine diphosphokinase [Candidatus Cloacimonadota bacterium]MCB5257885.1 thiamine diphosphokinase [Candidatus Cloacimonadota bacterium]MDD5624136.1 thiamine diphosphokinase [Candidatus Cloacimonadota bacterium]MDY0111332.1 thiamine diphosphokinase [Candidatus Syntrophosphaera sp.]
MKKEADTAWLFTTTSPNEIFSFYKNIDYNRDFIIAVDAGLNRVNKLGIEPDLIVGDMDTVSPELLAKYPNTKKINYEMQKNHTDTELAVLWCLEHNIKQVIIINGLTNRFDHSLGLLQNLALLNSEKIPARIESEKQVVLFLGKKSQFKGYEGSLLSLFSWSAESTIKDSEGLFFPLKNLTLSQFHTRGISNIVISSSLTIELDKGLILAIFTK